jgi:hypothetical protein
MKFIFFLAFWLVMVASFAISATLKSDSVESALLDLSQTSPKPQVTPSKSKGSKTGDDSISSESLEFSFISLVKRKISLCLRRKLKFIEKIPELI